jgi:hypothetical protein
MPARSLFRIVASRKSATTPKPTARALSAQLVDRRELAIFNAVTFRQQRDWSTSLAAAHQASNSVNIAASVFDRNRT